MLGKPPTRGNSGDRLHAAEPRRDRGPPAHRLGHRRQRRDGHALRLRPAGQGGAARDRLGARRSGRARPRPPLDRRTFRRRAPAGAVEPGAARPAAAALARRAADLARSGASEERRRDRPPHLQTTSRSRSCSAPTSSIRWSTRSIAFSISAGRGCNRPRSTRLSPDPCCHAFTGRISKSSASKTAIS